MDKKVFIALVVKYERVLDLIFKIDVCYQVLPFLSVVQSEIRIRLYCK